MYAVSFRVIGDNNILCLVSGCNKNDMLGVIHTPAWLAQLGEHWSAERGWEVAGSNPSRTNTQDR